MPLNPRARKVIGCVGGGVLAVAVLLAVTVWLFFRPEHEDLASYSFEPDVQIRLFAESDFDRPRTLYYEVRREGRVVSPGTMIGLAPEGISPVGASTGSSADGSVVAVWSSSTARGLDSFVILYHLPSGESWPRLRDDETASQPAVQAKWRARYALLRQRYGALPSAEDVIGR